jgi:putative endonuclease
MNRTSPDENNLGEIGEQAAAEHLESKGFRILARRWRHGHKEIDLIARKRELVVFVEVKCRSSESFAPLQTSVTAAKQRNLVEAASGWLSQSNQQQEADVTYRFDVILIRASTKGKPVSVEHIEDAFRA